MFVGVGEEVGSVMCEEGVDRTVPNPETLKLNFGQL